MERGLEPQLFCRTCNVDRVHETRYRSDDEFIGKILVCEHCGETIFEPLRMGCADC
jgi:rubrerythrin